MSKISKIFKNLASASTVVSPLIDKNVYPDKQDSYSGNSIVDKAVQIIDFSNECNDSAFVQNCLKDRALYVVSSRVADIDFLKLRDSDIFVFPPTILINVLDTNQPFDFPALYFEIQEEVKYLEGLDCLSKIVFLQRYSDTSVTYKETVERFAKGLSSVLFRHKILVNCISVQNKVPGTEMGGVP